jgi:hypothetical protein
MSLDVTLSKSYPACSCCGRDATTEYFFSSNITHNLGKMAGAADIYYELWRPEEIGITKAAELIEPLKRGLQLLKENPAKFQQFDSPNGWGLYKHFIPWIEEYLQTCIDNPDADVSVSR